MTTEQPRFKRKPTMPPQVVDSGYKIMSDAFRKDAIKWEALASSMYDMVQKIVAVEDVYKTAPTRHAVAIDTARKALKYYELAILTWDQEHDDD